METPSPERLFATILGHLDGPLAVTDEAMRRNPGTFWVDVQWDEAQQVWWCYPVRVVHEISPGAFMEVEDAGQRGATEEVPGVQGSAGLPELLGDHVGGASGEGVLDGAAGHGDHDVQHLGPDVPGAAG